MVQSFFFCFSFFGSMELPNLNKSNVIELKILVVHNIGGPIL